jgi:hypothetical protein
MTGSCIGYLYYLDIVFKIAIVLNVTQLYIEDEIINYSSLIFYIIMRYMLFIYYTF